ncbi:MAG: Glutathione S-transferase domain protein [uncultured Thiotrichaceae bacterium]|uniref:Glutathione S-transferase domain protein n=1 Tax=uncultured Thiotrichaceae bacterium TaxID=298394 RepID=A0A6S6TDT8_9GAMM|nr:MAG: Glutathione S-transferase domain protein [uncultured Thiotrichaceae bacterium]
MSAPISTLPILYSLQNCPYAMRARLAILLAQQKVQIRAITMKEKPAEMLLASPKATVPVLVIKAEDAGEDQVIDESLDVMLWALNLNDPENLLYSHDQKALAEMLKVIAENDLEFKPSLEKYKRAKRFHGDDLEDCRLECEPFILALEQRLSHHAFLMGSTPSLLDYALLPFIRQFSRVNKPVFAEERYTNIRRWLRHHLQSRLFGKAMFKYSLWLDKHEECLLN